MKDIKKIKEVIILIALVVLQYQIQAQAPKSAELIAKRYSVYHATFKGGVDLYRASFKDIKGILTDNAPEIIDSLEYSYLNNSSLNKAYCPTTGFIIEKVGRFIKINGVEEHTNAFRAGIRNEQYILSIHGVYPMHVKHAWELLSNQKDIKLELLTGNLKKLVSFQRAQKEIRSISCTVENRIATIRLHTLDKDMVKKYLESTSTISNGSLDTIVLDLRSILGMGDLQSVLRIADEFIPDNTDIMEIESGTAIYTYTSSGNAPLGNIPLKVLIDSTTKEYGLVLAGLLATYANGELTGGHTSINGRIYTVHKVQEMPAYYVRIPIHNYTIGNELILHERGLAPKTVKQDKSDITYK
jgi:C-terminal processing protease CtpA/Prc